MNKPKRFSVQGFENPTLAHLVRLVEFLGQEAAWALIQKARDCNGCKYGEFTPGQLQAFLDGLLRDAPSTSPERAIGEVLGGDLIAEVTFRYKEGLLVDHGGRCLPQPGMTPFQRAESDKGYMLGLSDDDPLTGPPLYWRMAELAGHPTSHVFTSIRREVVKLLKADWRLKNLLGGPAYPIILPKNETEFGYTEYLIQLYIHLGRVHDHDYAPCSRTIQSYKDILDPGYQRLMDRLSTRRVRGVLFPNCFQGWPVAAQREFVSHLPDYISLAGPLEFTQLFALYRDVLVDRPGSGLMHDCSAVQLSDKPGDTICFYVPTQARKLAIATFPCDRAAPLLGQRSGGLFVQLPDEV